MSALDYLQQKEWSMGNGQCPECCGVHAGWLGHLLYLTDENIGHKETCALAAAIKDVGGEPLMIGQMKSGRRFESYWTDKGFRATREVTT
jgi:hypothetical protein